MPPSSHDPLPALTELLRERIVVVDGAMGTMIQSLGLAEEDFRGDRFADHPVPLKGCSDVLSLTQPDAIEGIHMRFMRAGADIIETNSFTATAVSLADYRIAEHARAINAAAARIGRRAADKMMAAEPDRPRFVAGSMGPTNTTASLSPDVNDPGFRAVTFGDLVDSYYEQAAGLLEGGVDLLLPETATDTLNMNAALFAIARLFDEGWRRVPVMSSMTITNRSGRTLSGQTVEAYYNSVSHMDLLWVGVNCALGAEEMRPYVEELAGICSTYTACVPNAGLPNEFGAYDQTPAEMAAIILDFAERGWVNVVGGCCGTRPEHIAAVAEAVQGLPPRERVTPTPHTRLAGLEPLTITPESNFIMIGERTNVTGSRKFQRLISEERYEDALQVARQQVDGGANIIDVCMDEGMLDSEAVMTRFLNLIASEPDIARVPIMIDSSKFSVIEAGLRCVQGKGVVNSISLKEGEDEFRRLARLIRRYGAAVVVMGFDETGQATTVDHRLAIARRCYRILTEEVGFPPEDIIFDPNILTVGTGMEEHNDYAVSFIEATRLIKEEMPLVKISGGVSNISFSFRGNNPVREAMHAAFLYHAIAAGMDMGIVNAGQLEVYDEIPAELREYVEDVLLNRRPDATERLIDLASSYKAAGGDREVEKAAWRDEPLAERLAHALIKGDTEYVDVDVAEALEQYAKPLDIIEGPLMDGMNRVGELFGAGKMFLPQVVKSARVMKKAVAILEPLMDAERARESAGGKGKMVLATVKGDVHDIGKNITAVVLRCNGYEIIDLGVMVPARKILEVAEEENADIIGLSGLITPSLDEMIHVAREMERLEMKRPLLIGGATTSGKHTAVKIAPGYSGPVVHVKDASLAVGVMSRLLSDEQRPGYVAEVRAKQETIRKNFTASQKSRPLLALDEARARPEVIEWRAEDVPTPEFTGVREVEMALAELLPWIDWSPFFHTWELKGRYPAILEHPRYGEKARELLADGQALLDKIIKGGRLRARGVYGFFPACSDGDDIVILSADRSEERLRFPMMRQQGDKKVCYCLADFVAPRQSGLDDHIGAFAVTAGLGIDELVAEFKADHDDYHAIMAKALADRLAEALAEMLHKRVRDEWGYGDNGSSADLDFAAILSEKYRGIRPAFGYPACPDHSLTRDLFALLEATERTGIELTETAVMVPGASVSGIYLAHPRARYFSVGRIGPEQEADYARRRGR